MCTHFNKVNLGGYSSIEVYGIYVEIFCTASLYPSCLVFIPPTVQHSNWGGDLHLADHLGY